MSLFNDKFFADMDSEHKLALQMIPDRETEAKYIIAARNGSKDAIRFLSGLCYPTIIKMATGNPRYRRWKGNFGELVSEAIAALPGAVMDFDLSKGVRFITYFNARIMNALNKALFADNIVQWPENRLRNGETVTPVAFASSSDHPTDDERASNAPRMDILLNEDHAAEIVNRIDRNTLRTAIQEQAAAALDSKEETDLLLAMYKDEEWSVPEHARRTGLTPSVVRRIKNTVFAKMRNRTVLQEHVEELFQKNF